MKTGRASWQKVGGNKKRFQYGADSSRTILFIRALQSHSGHNHIDPSLQDNVLILDDFFKYNHHVGFAINISLRRGDLMAIAMGGLKNK